MATSEMQKKSLDLISSIELLAAAFLISCKERTFTLTQVIFR